MLEGTEQDLNGFNVKIKKPPVCMAPARHTFMGTTTERERGPILTTTLASTETHIERCGVSVYAPRFITPKIVDTNNT